jgi:hypothetical protein
MAETELQDALVAITSDSLARRELLWLGAMEQQDEGEARRLERLEEGLAEHMQALLAEHLGPRSLTAVAGGAGTPPDDPPKGAPVPYAGLFNERWAYHATRLTGRPWQQRW